MKFKAVIGTVNKKLPDGRVFVTLGELETRPLPLPVISRGTSADGYISCAYVSGNDLCAEGDISASAELFEAIHREQFVLFADVDDMEFEHRPDVVRVLRWRLIGAHLIPTECVSKEYRSDKTLTLLEGE